MIAFRHIWIKILRVFNVNVIKQRRNNVGCLLPGALHFSFATLVALKQKVTLLVSCYYNHNTIMTT